MIRYLSNASRPKLAGTALLRLDFNTEDEWRMKAALPTIRFLLAAGAKIAIVSHRGRPSHSTFRVKGRMGTFDRKSSLKRDGRQLERFLKHRVHFIPHFNFKGIRTKIQNSAARSIFLLENIRFLKGEEENSSILAKKLAELGNYYVNDAFAVSHRDDASVEAITRFLPSYAGLELESEIKRLSHILGRPKHPLVMIFGGGKAHDKLKVIRYFKKKADTFLVGGAAANTILRINGVNVGESLYDRNPGMTIREIIHYKNIFLPIDYVVEGNTIFDVGVKTVKFFAGKIKNARTVIWNGPVGVIEKKEFHKGTLGIARAIAKNRRAFSVVGGGETVMFLKKYGLDKKFSFVSTGGGAMLEYLAGEKLPGIKALKRSRVVLKR